MPFAASRRPARAAEIRPIRVLRDPFCFVILIGNDRENRIPIFYTVSPALKLVVVTATGVCGREDMDKLRADLLADERLAPGMRMLFETTQVESRLSFVDLQEIAGRLEGIFNKGINRVAVVADTKFIYSMAKTFAMFAANQPVRMQPFKDVESAVKWLNDGVLDPGLLELAETAPQSIIDRDSGLDDVPRRRRTPAHLKKLGT